MIVIELGVKPHEHKFQKSSNKNNPNLRRIMFADLTGFINGVAFEKNMAQKNDLKSGQVSIVN